jgi:hypothetical protein
MSRFRVYIKPFDESGEYLADWLDVTEDVDMDGLTVMKQSLDNNEYDVGIFKNSGVTLKLINAEGQYADAGQPGSIFKFRRMNSLVKITWEIMHQDVICGFAICGNVALSEEVIAFEGLLDDRGLKQNADDQSLTFKVLGKEAVLDQVEVPFSSISAGDTFEEIILALLDQTVITELLTVSASNISCSVDSITDDIADLENKTVREALAEILLYSNSVLYIVDDVIFVSPRTAGATVEKVFYGQGAQYGIENINDLADYRAGLNRVFNYWTWQDTDLVSQDLSSVGMFGVLKKEIETSLITNNTRRQTILDSLKDEFRNAKREMILRVPIDYETIALNVLDKVSIDYPNIPINDSAEIPLWDLSTWDEAVFPHEVLPISIESNAEFKILSKDIDPKNHEMVFYVREV